jgi:plastocyanin
MTRATALLLALFAGASAQAAGVAVTVTDASNHPVDQVVVIVEPVGGDRGAAAPRSGGQRTVIDQKNLRFVPEISVVRTGTSIEFPNSDQVRHQVYSFSPAKNFKLALYAGKIYPPLAFDKPGLVTLGCNIHDSMIGFVYVTDSPWFGKTGTQGRVDIAAVPPGDYRVRLWHPRFAPDEAQIELPLKVPATGDANLPVSLKRSLQPEPGNNTSNKWKGY